MLKRTGRSDLSRKVYRSILEQLGAKPTPEVEPEPAKVKKPKSKGLKAKPDAVEQETKPYVALMYRTPDWAET